MRVIQPLVDKLLEARIVEHLDNNLRTRVYTLSLKIDSLPVRIRRTLFSIEVWRAGKPAEYITLPILAATKLRKKLREYDKQEKPNTKWLQLLE